MKFEAIYSLIESGDYMLEHALTYIGIAKCNSQLTEVEYNILLNLMFKLRETGIEA